MTKATDGVHGSGAIEDLGGRDAISIPVAAAGGGFLYHLRILFKNFSRGKDQAGDEFSGGGGECMDEWGGEEGGISGRFEIQTCEERLCAFIGCEESSCYKLGLGGSKDQIFILE